ncbi:MAG: Mu transposase C-terminal domain-containing protein [Pyrinomonadaceae bacterium MAG19_C2-C3]|nr:Mu transposase C-terminal domain-containing protein [Pyrinomonadaceae bacterium MAG19_C2-C3]
MWIELAQIIELGVSRPTIFRKISRGEWKAQDAAVGNLRRGRPSKEVLLSSLPDELQAAWARQNGADSADSADMDDVSGETEQKHEQKQEQLHTLLLRYPAVEREAFLAEAQRLAMIVESYMSIKPKQQRNSQTGKLEFVTAVRALCLKAACTDAAVLAREPHRAKSPAPHTLDGWARGYAKDGLLVFFRSAPAQVSTKDDRRRAEISSQAMQWINANWRNFRNPSHLHKALIKRARTNKWQIPSQAWTYRLWKTMPEIVRTVHIEGVKAYTSRQAPYVPRDASDVGALQILCGDHSLRDVTVRLPDGSLVRPWLTAWQDIRTGLIWGWTLGLVPSSHSAGLAYANGVRTFGAQPLARSVDDYSSYLYTDQGRDYKSQLWDGKTIAIHKHAMRIEGGLEVLRVQRRVGFCDETHLKHILARGYNGREKPIERTFKDLSDWEQNKFKEFCGRDAKNKPDEWVKRWHQHQRIAGAKGGKQRFDDSPFMLLEDYREHLAGWIAEYNEGEHTRMTLGGATIVPLDEYRRLYTTHFSISEEALSLLLMKAESRVIGKNGVSLFRRDWSFLHESMSAHKGETVEVRYDDGDYTRVWVVLPATASEPSRIVEASLVTRSGLLNPNKATLKTIAETAARERKLIRDFNFVTQSRLRGETVEDRVAAALEQCVEVEEMPQVAVAGGGSETARVHQMTRMDAPKIRAVRPRTLTASDAASITARADIFTETPCRGRVSEFDFEDED